MSIDRHLKQLLASKARWQMSSASEALRSLRWNFIAQLQWVEPLGTSERKRAAACLILPNNTA